MEKLYKFYNMSDEIFKFYLADTKNGKNCTKECVERKILAMMLSAPTCIDNGMGCKKYQFGTFTILVREDSDEIGMIYWSKHSNNISSKESKNLRNLYKLLGLTEEGHEIIKDIDETNLNFYINENKLSNVGVWKKYFKKMDKEKLI